MNLPAGVLVPGGFGTRGVEGKIAAAHWARTNDKPYLGICLGLQCAVIEFARNVLKMKDAHTTEIEPNTTNPVVIDMPEHNQVIYRSCASLENPVGGRPTEAVVICAFLSFIKT